MDMKKISIIAAVAVAALFTACNDDSTSASAAPQVECKVTTTESSATATMIAAGMSTTTTFMLTEDGYKIIYDGVGAENMEPVEVPTKVTKDELVEMANKSCEMMNK